MAVLATRGAERVAAGQLRPAAVALAATAAVLWGAGPVTSAWGSGAVAALLTAAAPVLAARAFLPACAAALLAAAPRAAGLLPVVVLADLLLIGPKFVPTIERAYFDPPPAAAWVRDGRLLSDERWRAAADPPGVPRVEANTRAARLGLADGIGALWGVRYVDGMESMAPATVAGIRGGADAAPDSGARALASFSGRWRLQHAAWPRPPDPWRPVRAEAGAVLYENPLALPRARIEGGAGAAAIEADRGNFVEVRVEAEAPAVLVLADSPDPGWRAVIDGAPAPWRPAGEFGRAVDLPAGRSRVVFVYTPPGLREGLVLSSIGLLALAAPSPRGVK